MLSETQISDIWNNQHKGQSIKRFYYIDMAKAIDSSIDRVDSIISVPETRQIIDPEKCAACEHRYGTITGRYVIYRGDDTEVDGVQYTVNDERIGGNRFGFIRLSFGR